MEPARDPGFALAPGVFDPSEVDALLALLAAVPRGRAGARHLMRLGPVAALAHDARLLALAGRALGGAATPFGATLFDKSADRNWLVAWHQDTALPLRERVDVAGWGPWSRKEGVDYAHAPGAALEQVVALRVHIDDSTGANGPLRVLPETHTLGVLSDEEVAAVSRRVPAVACTIARGGVVAMRPLLIHASSKAQDAAPRRVLHIEYASRIAFGPDLHLAVPEVAFG